MFGPKTAEVIIFNKTKQWWDYLHKLHIPAERFKFSEEELTEIAKEMQKIELEVRYMQLLQKTSLEKMIDFQKLTKAFYKEKGYSFGVPVRIKIVEKKVIES